MNDSQDLAAQARYLIKVLLALALVALEVFIALCLPHSEASATTRQIVIALLIAIMLMQAQAIRWLYGRADELQQAMHRQACTRCVAWLAAGSAIAGVLQANDVIPVFNQLWMLAALLAVWSVQLMLADRPHH